MGTIKKRTQSPPQVKEYCEILRQLTEAFRKLSLKNQPSAIPSNPEEESIRHITKSQVDSGVIEVAVRNIIQLYGAELPIRRGPTVSDELLALQKAADQLSVILKGLRKDTRTRLGMFDGDPLEIATLPRRLEKLSAIRTQPNKGAPPKIATGRITDIAYDAYLKLTGVKPRRITSQTGEAKGEFLDLLEEIFQSLQIKASPEHQFREAEKRHNSMEFNKPKTNG